MFPMKYFTRLDAGPQTTSQMNAERPELFKVQRNLNNKNILRQEFQFLTTYYWYLIS